MPQQARDVLLQLEQIVNKWEGYADAMPKPSTRLDASGRLAAATEREAVESAERQRLDEALLATFKEQVRAPLVAPPPPPPPTPPHATPPPLPCAGNLTPAAGYHPSYACA